MRALLLLASVTALTTVKPKQPHPLFLLSQSNTPKNVNKVLAGDVSNVDVKALLNALPLRPPDKARATEAFTRDGAVVAREGVLSPEACRDLRDYAGRFMLSEFSGAANTELDSVDGAPAHQTNLPKSALRDILGRDGYNRLLAPATEVLGASPRDVSAFIRKYSPASRPRLPFHCDGCDASISVNLVDHEAYEGGDLLMLADGGVRFAPRALGAAAAHHADVAHAVADVSRGTRWSLVVFCHRTRNWRRKFRVGKDGKVKRR